MSSSSVSKQRPPVAPLVSCPTSFRFLFLYFYFTKKVFGTRKFSAKLVMNSNMHNFIPSILPLSYVMDAKQ